VTAGVLTEPDRNRRNLRWAWVIGGLVLLAGLIVIVAPAALHSGSLFDDPFVGRTERKTVETFDAGGAPTGREVTTEPAGSWLERSLGPGGVLLLRLAVVAVAAFMAGALAYRTASGNFPTEVAGVVFGEKTAGGLDELNRNVVSLALGVESLRSELNRVSAVGDKGVAALGELTDKLELIQQEHDALSATVVDLTSGLAEAVADIEVLKARRRQPKAQ
jgi:hypothetical protein